MYKNIYDINNEDANTQLYDQYSRQIFTNGQDTG